MMKFIEFFGNALLTGAAVWALITSKSTFQYDSISYSCFFSLGISELLANSKFIFYLNFDHESILLVVFTNYLQLYLPCNYKEFTIPKTYFDPKES